MTRPLSHSSADRNLLDNDLTRSLTFQVELLDSYPSSAMVVSFPSSPPSSYSPKTIQTTARYSASSMQHSQLPRRRSANGPRVRTRATMDILLSTVTSQVPLLRLLLLPKPASHHQRLFSNSCIGAYYIALGPLPHHSYVFFDRPSR